jgi:hypothetical protein
MELYFTYDLDDDSFEFKILSDIDTKSLKSEGNNKLRLEVANNLEKSSSYIVMVLSIKDAIGNSVSLEDDLYDLITPSNLIEDVKEEVIVIATPEEKEVFVEKGNVEEVALNSAETPET